MNLPDIAIMAVIAAAVVLAVISSFRRKESGCCENCGGCGCCKTSKRNTDI